MEHAERRVEIHRKRMKKKNRSRKESRQ